MKKHETNTSSKAVLSGVITKTNFTPVHPMKVIAEGEEGNLGTFLAVHYPLLRETNGAGRFTYEFHRRFCKHKERLNEHALLIANVLLLSTQSNPYLIGIDTDSKLLGIECENTDYGYKTTVIGHRTRLIVKTVLEGTVEDVVSKAVKLVDTNNDVIQDVNFDGLLSALKNAKDVLVDKDYHWASFTKCVFKNKNTHLLEAYFNNQLGVDYVK